MLGGGRFVCGWGRGLIPFFRELPGFADKGSVVLYVGVVFITIYFENALFDPLLHAIAMGVGVGGSAAVEVVTYLDSEFVELLSTRRRRNSICFFIGVAVSSFPLPVGQIVRFGVGRVFL